MNQISTAPNASGSNATRLLTTKFFVGAGAYNVDNTIKPMSKVMPSYVNWIKEHAEEFMPESNSVKTNNGTYTYDYLIVCPGLKINLDGVAGLKENLGKNNICTNYSAEMATYTWECLKNIQVGIYFFRINDRPSDNGIKENSTLLSSLIF